MLVEKRKPMTSYAKAGILGLALLAAVAGLASCTNPIVEAVDGLRADAVSPRIVLSLPDNSSLASGGTASFGQISSGTSASLSIAVGNEGKSALAVDVAGITLTLANGTENGTFSIASLPSASIASGGFSTLSIAFSPSSTGPKSALVSIPTNDTKNPAVSFTVSGSGSSLVISTAMASAITTVSATGGGNITFNGGLSVTSRGICWGSSPYPTVADHSSSDGSTGDGEYTGAMNGLAPGSLYYARAWAATSAGITYGPQVSFTTLPAAPAPPSVSALPYADGSGKLAVSWSAVYGSGICYDVYCATVPTRPGSARLSGLSATSCTLEGLIDYTSYYVWIVARNATGPGADSPTMGSPVMVGVKVTSITLSKNSATFLEGSSETITATCFPATATLSGVTWSSSNAAIAAVSGGVVTGGTVPVGKTAETATITAEAADGQGASVSFSATTKKYSAGITGPAGGIMVYDAGDYSKGWRYLEAAPVNIGAGLPWGPAYTNIPTATGFGDGLPNTLAIIAALGNGNYMANACRSYSLNGYSDWFMPSRDEANFVLSYALGVPGIQAILYFETSSLYNSTSPFHCHAYQTYSSTYADWSHVSVFNTGSTIITRPTRRF